MKAIRSFFLFPGVALAAAVTAGCGSTAAPAADNAAPDSAAASPSAAAATLGCSLAPASKVSAVLGISGLSAPKEESGGSFAGCVYSGGSAGAPVSIQMMSTSGSAKMALEQKTMSKSETVKVFPGLGDQAFVATISAGPMTETTLVARKGAVQLMVESTASADSEKTLEQQIFAKAG